eukprot:2089677-Rhodomonas_salina.1
MNKDDLSLNQEGQKQETDKSHLEEANIAESSMKTLPKETFNEICDALLSSTALNNTEVSSEPQSSNASRKRAISDLADDLACTRETTPT